LTVDRNFLPLLVVATALSACASIGGIRTDRQRAERIQECHDMRVELVPPPVLSVHGSLKGVRLGRRTEPHSGVDLAAPVGMPVIASTSGIVTMTYHDPEAGFVIEIYNQRLKIYSLYAHLQALEVSHGSSVKQGSVLGLVGLFKRSAGVPHVHWEVCTKPCVGKLASTVDPLKDGLICFGQPGVQADWSLPISCRRHRSPCAPADDPTIPTEGDPG